MNKPAVVVGKEKKKAAQRFGPEAGRRTAGQVLGWAGVALLLMGGLDFALTWYPMDFGNREWEFGTITASFNGLPILVVGLAALLVGSIGARRRWWAFLAVAVSVGMALWVVAGAVLYATNVPLALRAVPVEVATGMKKAVVKTTGQSIVYPLVFAYLAWKSWSATRITSDQ